MSNESTVIKRFISEIENRGGKEEDFYRLAASGGAEKELLDRLADLIVQETRNIYRISVDYDTSLADMLAAGKYDWGNSDVNDVNFPIPPEFSGLGKVDVNLELVCFGKKMDSYEEVLEELDSRGLRPGILPELLAFGARYPNKQLEYPVMEVGSIWQDRGGHRGIFLRKGKKERGISVVWLKYGWGPYYRFIAVRKESPIS